MLGSKKAGFGASGNTTLVARDTIIVGDIHFGGNLDIEGVVQGNIIAEEGKDALVRVIEKGRVEGVYQRRLKIEVKIIQFLAKPLRVVETYPTFFRSLPNKS